MSVEDSPTAGPLARGFTRWVAAIEDGALIALLGGMIGLATIQIILRNIFGTAIMWVDPALRVAVLWLGLLGAVAASREGRHITVDALSRALPKRWQTLSAALTDLFTAGVSLALAWYGARLVMEDRAAGIEAFSSIPVWVCELILPVAFLLIAVRHILAIIRRFRQREAAQ
ncbi:MAG: TRAP transporter small permease [bacterium]|nr:TRAP transporter small permease [bacterium]